jgi:peptidoglycan/xylan/chitin deacetylase (PgdA/CDA1 family)
MSVFVFMYHRTPAEAQDRFDVSLSTFKAQVDALIEAGVKIVPFDAVNDHAAPRHGKYACITFDDGHASNAPAYEYLAERGVRPASFIVRRWAETGVGEHGAGYMQAEELQAIAPICDLGAHGVNHVCLAKIPLAEAAEELCSSRAYLERILDRKVDTMALPGGSQSPQVMASARAAGYRLIGTSVASPHTLGGDAVNRIVVPRAARDDFLIRTVREPGVLWATREAERSFRRTRRETMRRIRSSLSAFGGRAPLAAEA